MAGDAVMTVRIDSRLLAALKTRAKRDGRSTSAELVWLIHKEIAAPPKVKPRPAMGMFSDYDAPVLDTFRKARRGASAALPQRARRRKPAR